MIQNAIFKPGVGVVDAITGRILFPDAFGVVGRGVYNYRDASLILSEADLRQDPRSALPIDDLTNPTNRLNNLFGLNTLEQQQMDYRRPKILLTRVDTNVDSDRSVKEVEDLIGTLIQPYTYIQWGGVDLEPRWFRDITFEWGEDETPGGITFTLDPLAPFADLPMGENGEGAEIYMEIGYTEKRTLSAYFIHTGTTIESGNSMRVTIEGSHKTFEADQTPQRNRYYVGQNDEIVLDKNIKDALSPYNIKYKALYPDKEKYKFRTSSQAETDMRYALRLNQSYGLTTNYSFSKEADIVVRPAGLSKRKPPKPASEGGKTDHIDSVVFYLGPGLITTITRKTVARKVSTSPPKDKIASESNASVDVKKAPAKDPIKKTTQNFSGVSDDVGALKDTQITDTKKIRNKKGGDPTGPAAKANKPLSPNESKDSEEKDTDLEKTVNEDKEEKLEQGQIEFDTSFIMVPRVVGIKPSDIVVIMWMEDGDEVYQDFLISSVSYSQEGANYRVSISGSRWLKEEPMTDNWDEIVADMKQLGLLDGSGQNHGDKLYGSIDDHYPRYRNWINYYWGES